MADENDNRQETAGQKPMKLWGGRFKSGPSPTFERFSGSLHFDRRLIGADIEGSQAYARALTRVGILTSDEASTICKALASIDPDSAAQSNDEDVHTYVIGCLKEKAGPVADKIHTGRSRNEQVSLDTRLWLRGRIDGTLGLLRGLMSALLDLAARYPEAVVPGYTHMRRAQAVLWPHYLLAYYEMLMRDHERLTQARSRVNVMPLGSGALAGSGFPVDRVALASELGFESITLNSMDVSGDRDFVLDFLSAASIAMVHLSRLAEDWILYSSEEFDWLELGDGVTSGSSLMPQKKNPDSMELVRGKSGRVIGALTAVLVLMKGLPMTYNRDMQEDKEQLFDAADTLASSLEMVREVIDTTSLKPERPRQAAEDSWVVATDLAEALARSGVAFHQAHVLAGQLVLESVQTGKKPADWTPDALVAFDPRFTPEMASLMDPGQGMKTRRAHGGTAPETVLAALSEARTRLEKLS
ncbi:MAG TPA: argininosuccinate lyase [Bryobacteraceae bacterium]|nr:argininosuccinate lyase [Bryobacteraceae bacterium]